MFFPRRSMTYAIPVSVNFTIIRPSVLMLLPFVKPTTYLTLFRGFVKTIFTDWHNIFNSGKKTYSEPNFLTALDPESALSNNALGRDTLTPQGVQKEI